ncbi:MAG TPA: phosphoribosylaminoimidazolesuccinocarboxamide synthase [Spirochaetia bacterium]|nr:phosphoribosylaminoimidazolesuccinocarboxamide synthase [Spirochaetia bacterium]
MERNKLSGLLPKTLREIDPFHLQMKSVGKGTALIKGKVRDILDLGQDLIILTTDRISAFDRVLTTIPCKGEVLNQISLFWFGKTEDIISNHIIDTLSPRSVLVNKCEVIPLEVVVRGYLTGSAWRGYEKGEDIPGFRLKPGLRFNERFPEPLVTPSTKEEQGHDKPVSRAEIIETEIVSETLWDQIEQTALSLFTRGTGMVRENGLILVDTKYEFGLFQGRLCLIDEIHTPDSSRYWYADTYQERFSRGEAQRELDKEYLRRWLMDRGYRGDGDPPIIPDEIRLDVAERYITAFELITGRSFEAASLGPDEELAAIGERLDSRGEKPPRK